ncbi:olfactory receptor 5AR1-like [Emydura macquarii macquarii]|uniref:olfactory receptor 5AR1-like n=1 Tax=Emydura macquarii macquarii TaxID=1129001 RepID=UPI003529FF90
MAGGNSTGVTEFILLGLTDCLKIQISLFIVFLLIYSITVAGNLGMIVLIKVDSRLHSPMYYFLSSLSFVDFCYSSAVIPKTLTTFLTGRKEISFIGCAAQLYVCGACAISECYLLAVMAYDRYVAICNPLLYTTTMTKSICAQLVIGSYTMGTVSMSVIIVSVFSLPFCSSNVINHFVCDIPPLLSLSCTDTRSNEIILFAIAGFADLSTILAVLISYSFITSAILQIRSVEGKSKAFSTCASHLMAVTIFYGTLSFVYLRPSSSYSLNTDKVTTVFYTMIIPMLNPLIYSLRNKEVKDAFITDFQRTFSFKLQSYICETLQNKKFC